MVLYQLWLGRSCNVPVWYYTNFGWVGVVGKNTHTNGERDNPRPTQPTKNKRKNIQETRFPTYHFEFVAFFWGGGLVGLAL